MAAPALDAALRKMATENSTAEVVAAGVSVLSKVVRFAALVLVLVPAPVLVLVPVLLLLLLL